jgi:outer membrane protein OmpA-like peptidoglycan-associated protein
VIVLTNIKKSIYRACFIFYLLLSCSLTAQNPSYAYKNDFSDPLLFFSAAKSEKGKTWCSDGKYFMQYSVPGKSWRQTSFVLYNTKADFIIETAITYAKAGASSSIGFVFGLKDPDHANYFLLDAGGKFMIVQTDGERVTAVKDWTSSAALKPRGSENVLKAERKNDAFTFYINDVKVADAEELKMFGSQIGFYIEGEASLEADYLNVLQEKKPVNLVADYELFGEKELLGPEINSPYGEKHPIISPDGKYLYVNRENHPKNLDGIKEDVWCSEMKNGKWTPMKNLGRPINNKDFNYIAGISADNTVLLLGNVYDAVNNTMKEGFSISEKTKNGWGFPVPLKIDNYYNNNNYNGACIAADKNVIIMTVERDDSYGEKDLYVIFRKSDNTWTEPLNMGSVINSWAAEFGPYLAPDGKTLYFASLGHPGYGEADLFVSKRLDETWTNWSTPQNLGPKVNTKFWDGYFSVSAKGSYAYISSTQHGRTDLDAYQIKIPRSISGEAIVLVKGKVLNDKSKLPMGASLKLIERPAGKIVQEIKSGDKTGEYSILITKSGTYDIAAFHDGFISIHKTLVVPEIETYKEYIQDLQLTPLEKGSTIVLKNIFFEANNFELLSTSNSELNQLVEILKTHPTLKISVAGHTSRTNEGEKFNLELSTNRAKAVKDYLVAAGIEENRIEHAGYGFSKPIYTQADEEHQAQNRRVEFTIISK